MEFVTNALGRQVPTRVNGREKRPFRKAFDIEYGEPYAGRPGMTSMQSGRAKTATKDDVLGIVEVIEWRDGTLLDTIFKPPV